MADEFAREVMKRAVATACSAFEFQTTQANTIDSMADVVRMYIEKLGELAKEHAESAGRSSVGTQDLIMCLDRLLPEATNWGELRDFAFEKVEQDDEGSYNLSPRWVQPFPSSVPAFPAKRRDTSMTPEYVAGDAGPDRRREHNIPSHLPAFPPHHTYKNTASGKRKRVVASHEAQQMKRIADNRAMQENIARIEMQASSSSSSSSSSAAASTSIGSTQAEAAAHKSVALPTETSALAGMASLTRRDVTDLGQVEKTGLGLGR